MLAVFKVIAAKGECLPAVDDGETCVPASCLAVVAGVSCDDDGYWQPLLAALDAMTENGFISKATRANLIVSDNPAKLLNALNNWTPPAPKWQKDQTQHQP